MVPFFRGDQSGFLAERKLSYVPDVLLCLRLSVFTPGLGLTGLRSASIVLRTFCPLCYKHIIAMSPRRIKDKFSLVFSKFSQFGKC